MILYSMPLHEESIRRNKFVQQFFPHGMSTEDKEKLLIAHNLMSVTLFVFYILCSHSKNTNRIFSETNC